MWPRNLLHQSAPTPPPSLSGVTKKLAPAGPLMRSWRRIAGAAKSLTSGQPSEGGAAATATAAACQATGSRSTLPAAAHAAVNERPGSVESSPTASEAHAALPSPMEGQSSGGSSEASAEGGAAPAHLPCYRHTFLRLRSSGDGATVAGGKPGAAKPRGLAGSSLQVAEAYVPLVTPTGCVGQLHITPQEAARLYTGEQGMAQISLLSWHAAACSACAGPFAACYVFPSFSLSPPTFWPVKSTPALCLLHYPSAGHHEPVPPPVLREAQRYCTFAGVAYGLQIVLWGKGKCVWLGQGGFWSWECRGCAGAVASPSACTRHGAGTRRACSGTRGPERARVPAWSRHPAGLWWNQGAGPASSHSHTCKCSPARHDSSRRPAAAGSCRCAWVTPARWRAAWAGPSRWRASSGRATSGRLWTSAVGTGVLYSYRYWYQWRARAGSVGWVHE